MKPVAGALVAALLSFSGPLGAQRSPPAAAGFTFEGPSFFAIQVEDVEAAAEWYAVTFGLTEVNRLEAEDGRFSIRLLSSESLTVELIRLRVARLGPPEPLFGLFKVGFFVDDIDAALGWLRASGANTDAEVFFDEALQARSFVFRDPFQNRLQAFERCGFARTRPGCG